MLLQGETSVGKTSLITWLARSSGNLCVRINNHEHTDLQEYIGCYAADQTGKLVFKEGKIGIHLDKQIINIENLMCLCLHIIIIYKNIN